MLYCFLTDTAFLDPESDMTNIATIDIPCGFMHPEILEYLMEQLVIRDRRAGRLPINYRVTEFSSDYNPYLYHTMNYLPIDLENNLLTNPTQTAGIAEFTGLGNTEGAHNDNLPILPTAMTLSKMNFIFDKTKAGADYAKFTGMSQNARGALLNIIEFLTYGTISSDTEAGVDAMLTGSVDFNNHVDGYGYKPGSLTLSLAKSVVFVYDTLDIWRFIPNWFQFTFIDGDNEISFKIWTSRKDFENNYPLFNITEVIPPLNPTTLLNPNTIQNIWAAVNESSKKTVSKLTIKIKADNHSGYVGFTTPYIYNSLPHDLTFSILYKGRIPSVFEQRAAIVEYLLQFNTEEVWKDLFPGLFIEDQFYFVPLFEKIIPDSNNRYPSLCSVGDITQRVETILGNIVNNDMQTLEVMTSAYSKIFIGVVNGKPENTIPLSQVFPTYQNFSTTEYDFINLSEKAQGFAIRFNRALAIAFGESNDGEFYENIIDGMLFYSFIYDSIEFIIISRSDYILNIS